MCGLDPADVLMVEDDPGDALIAAVGRLAWCGAVRYVCGYRWHAGPRLHRQVSPPRSNATVWSMSHRLAGCRQPGNVHVGRRMRTRCWSLREGRYRILSPA
jgi:hypothetical protein